MTFSEDRGEAWPETAATGGCACGSLRYACDGAPFWTSYCHCVDCRQVTGAPVSVFVGWRAGAVHFETPPVERRGSAVTARLFCADCGTPVGYRDDRLPDELYLMAGTLDDPGHVRPRCHAWIEQAVSWLRIDDELPRYPRFSRSRGEDP